MNKTCIPILLILCLLFYNKLTAQETTNQDYSLEGIIESIMEGLDEETDFSSILEGLENYYKNPLNINSANKSDLEKLYFLNDFQISQIINYRDKTGSILSVYEMNAIDGLNREVLGKIAPFISFAPVSEILTAQKPARQQFLMRATRVLQKQKGFCKIKEQAPAYEGSREKVYTRYSFKKGNKITAGLTAEKDAGEAFFSGSNKSGFDYYSGHFSININSLIKNITVGDYCAKSGQGLVLWQGFARRKSDDPMQVIRSGPGVNPYSSTDENRFFRGVASTLEINNLEVQLFASLKKRDANIDGDENNKYFSSLQTSGYHRTESETEDERSISETSAGCVLAYQKNRLKIGCTFLYQGFNYPFVRNEIPSNYFLFTGKKNINGGLHYYYVLGSCQFFGEGAISKSGGIAFLQGLQANIHSQAGFSLLFRHFGRDYHSLTGNAFAEHSGNNNETGLYVGFKLLPFPKIRMLAYADYFKSPWVNYTTIAPSGGYETTVRVDYIHSAKLQLYLRFKSEKKQVKTVENEKYVNTNLSTRKLRFNIDYRIVNSLKFRDRLVFSYYKKNKAENGFAAYHDIIFTPSGIAVSLQARLAYIRTDSYNSRIYAYENDLLYNYSMPAYYGENIRCYLNLKYSVSQKLDLWLKISNSHYLSGSTIGSGYNQVTGKNITEVKMQFRLKI